MNILVGLLIPYSFGLVIYAARNFRAPLGLLVIVPLLMAGAAVWASVPDLPRLVGMGELYHRMSRDPASDIFLWHYTIDNFESERLGHWAQILSVLMGMSVVAAAWRELYVLEKER